MLEVHAYIEVSDLGRGVAFYEQALGLREARRFGAHWVELSGARLPIHLLARPEPTFETGDAVLQKDFGRHWTPVHLDFLVEDLDAATARAQAAGAVLERTVAYDGLWRMAALADPFGNGFDLIELVAGAYDRLAAAAAPR